MRNRSKKVERKAPDSSKHIRIQLDAKTVITVKDNSRFDVWRSVFPNARILPA
jgi:hypothetical protein